MRFFIRLNPLGEELHREATLNLDEISPKLPSRQKLKIKCEESEKEEQLPQKWQAIAVKAPATKKDEELQEMNKKRAIVYKQGN